MCTDGQMGVQDSSTKWCLKNAPINDDDDDDATDVKNIKPKTSYQFYKIQVSVNIRFAAKNKMMSLNIWLIHHSLSHLAQRNLTLKVCTENIILIASPKIIHSASVSIQKVWRKRFNFTSQTNKLEIFKTISDTISTNHSTYSICKLIKTGFICAVQNQMKITMNYTICTVKEDNFKLSKNNTYNLAPFYIGTVQR